MKKSKFLIGLGSSVALLSVPLSGCSSTPAKPDAEATQVKQAQQQQAEANCGADHKDAKDGAKAEASCGAKAKAKDAEAKCGEGKCGEGKCAEGKCGQK